MNDMLGTEFVDGLKCCPVCGGATFASKDVLWPELIDSWQLSESEIAYINRQQGFHCKQCNNNLRAMSLAVAILKEVGFSGILKQFCESGSAVKVIEMNTAGNLTQFLKKLPCHSLIEYPQFDMQHLDIVSESVDIVLHSDSLEHVPKPEKALSECCRVLHSKGKCIFSVPIIVDRLTRSRAALVPSYHGQPNVAAVDQLVFTEFGADVWQMVLKAGFSSCEFFSLEYPSAMTVIAKKIVML